MDKQALNSRLTERQQLLTAMGAFWPLFVCELEVLKADAVASLISQENAEVRGRVKCLLDLLEFPARLDAEVRDLAQTLKDLPE